MGSWQSAVLNRDVPPRTTTFHVTDARHESRTSTWVVSDDLVTGAGVEESSEPRERAPDLHAINDRYEVVGELRGSATTRYFFGRRRDDHRDVLISVVDGQAHGDNNALAHLASDSQILSTHEHPNVARVIEGHWLGSNSYVLITDRANGATLHEALSANGAIPNPRIATLLQQVNAALSWARDLGVVHRGVTSESMYIDPDSGHVQVVFSLTPIPLFGLPDAGADARTIGTLAWSMLAGRPHSESAPPLREVAPNLAERVINETTALANLSNSSEAPDVERFLSVVAMGDAIREGEVEMAELKAAFLEQQRIEATRSEARARAIEAHAIELEEKLARERAAFEARQRRDEARLAREKRQFAAERAQLDQERLEFSDRLAEFKLRSSIERPADPTTLIPPLASEEAEKALVGTGGRLGWLVPVGTVGLLVAMIVFGSVFAHHRPPATQTVIYGRGRAALPVGAQQSVIPRGGFLTQSAGNVAPRIIPKPVDSTTTHTRDSVARRDSIARRDLMARRDSVKRRDTIPPDTLARPDTLR